MPDPSAEARRWLDAAHEDLAYAAHAAGAGHHAPACFFSQQAAEKAVKAVHFARGARAVLGHNIRALIAQLDPPVAELSALIDDARELDLFYVPTRYPNGLDAGTPGQAFSKKQSSRAIEIAERILDAAAAAVASS